MTAGPRLFTKYGIGLSSFTSKSTLARPMPACQHPARSIPYAVASRRARRGASRVACLGLSIVTVTKELTANEVAWYNAVDGNPQLLAHGLRHGRACPPGARAEDPHPLNL